jgi:diphthine-ammonia ligase
MVKSVAVLFSGGKDSTYTIAKLRSMGYSVSCLITVISDNADSYMLHTPNIHLTRLSAEALEIPIVLGSTRGEKELELEDIKNTILTARKEYDFQILASGGIASEYQRGRLSAIAIATDLTPVNPLWGIDQEKYLSVLVDEGFRFILTSVSAMGLDEKWLGKEIDKDSALQLISLSRKFRFNPSLEGGEGETLVIDCPLYTRRSLKIVLADKLWDGFRGRLEVKKAVLVPKKTLVQNHGLS